MALKLSVRLSDAIRRVIHRVNERIKLFENIGAVGASMNKTETVRASLMETP